MIDALLEATAYTAVVIVALLFWGALVALTIAVAVELFFL